MATMDVVGGLVGELPVLERVTGLVPVVAGADLGGRGRGCASCSRRLVPGKLLLVLFLVSTILNSRSGDHV